MELCLPVCVCASFGACCGLWRRVQVEAAWAAAAQVVISGVVALNAATTAAINGRFEQVDREVYRKVGDPDMWLFVAKNGTWCVSTTAKKDARKTESAGWAHSMAPAGGMPPPAAASRWKVARAGGMWVEQTLQIRHRVVLPLVREQVSGNRSGTSDWQEQQWWRQHAARELLDPVEGTDDRVLRPDAGCVPHPIPYERSCATGYIDSRSNRDRLGAVVWKVNATTLRPRCYDGTDYGNGGRIVGGRIETGSMESAHRRSHGEAWQRRWHQQGSCCRCRKKVRGHHPNVFPVCTHSCVSSWFSLSVCSCGLLLKSFFGISKSFLTLGQRRRCHQHLLVCIRLMVCIWPVTESRCIGASS